MICQRFALQTNELVVRYNGLIPVINMWSSKMKIVSLFKNICIYEGSRSKAIIERKIAVIQSLGMHSLAIKINFSNEPFRF